MSNSLSQSGGLNVVQAPPDGRRVWERPVMHRLRANEAENAAGPGNDQNNLAS
jgi:hypothetical protein